MAARKSIGDIVEEIALGILSGAINAYSLSTPHPATEPQALRPVITEALEAGIADGTAHGQKTAEVPTLAEIRQCSDKKMPANCQGHRAWHEAYLKGFEIGFKEVHQKAFRTGWFS